MRKKILTNLIAFSLIVYIVVVLVSIYAYDIWAVVLYAVALAGYCVAVYILLDRLVLGELRKQSGLAASANESQKTAEDENLRLREELENAEKRILYARDSRSTFFSSIGHEIRTPMNAVIGMSELLTEDDLLPAQAEKIRGIKRYSDVLLSKIDDLLDFANMEEGTFKLDFRHYSLTEMLGAICEHISHEAHAKALDFNAELSGSLPACIYGDDARLRQVLLNLLDNALKYTDKGRIMLRAAENDGMLSFSVRDTGIGIKPENINKLFDPFEESEVRKSRGLTGMALGLVLTDKIIRMMNGSVTVESIHGYGSTFRVEIPYEQGNETLVTPTIRNRYSQPRSGFENTVYVSAPEAKVLLVDDIDINLKVGAEFFKLHDITPDTAGSAEEAVRLICGKDYDMVFLDHMMPGTSGVEAAKIIRSFAGKYKDLRIIALTANLTPEAREQMLEAGMNDILPKPMTKQALNQMLFAHLPAEKRELKIRGADTLEVSPDQYSAKIKAAALISGLNVKLGIQRSGGSVKAYEDSLHLLCNRIPKSLTALEITLQQDNERIYDFAVEAHGMKGALAIAGHEILSECAGELEAAARLAQLDTCKRMLPMLAAGLTELGLKLGEIFRGHSAGASGKTVKKDGDIGLFAEIAENLTIDIERFDRAAALGELNRAFSYTFGRERDILFEKIKDDLEDFDYDSAMERLLNI